MVPRLFEPELRTHTEPTQEPATTPHRGPDTRPTSLQACIFPFLTRTAPCAGTLLLEASPGWRAVDYCNYYPESPDAALLFLPKRGGVRRLLEYAFKHAPRSSGQVYIRSDQLADEVDAQVTPLAPQAEAPPIRTPIAHTMVEARVAGFEPNPSSVCTQTVGAGERVPGRLVTPDVWLQRRCARTPHVRERRCLWLRHATRQILLAATRREGRLAASISDGDAMASR